MKKGIMWSGVICWNFVVLENSQVLSPVRALVRPRRHDEASRISVLLEIIIPILQTEHPTLKFLAYLMPLYLYSRREDVPWH